VEHKRQTVQVRDLKSALFAVQRFRFLVDLVHAFDSERDPSGPALPVIASAPPMPMPMPLSFAEVGGGADTGLEATREQ
jgi:hypothetical protein